MIKGVLFAVIGGLFSMWSYFNWQSAGFKMAERGNIDQLDNGLFGLFLLIGISILAYGLIEIWLHKK